MCFLDLVKAKSFRMYHAKAKNLLELERRLLPLLPSDLRSDVAFSLRKSVLVVHLPSALLLLQLRAFEQVLLKACSSFLTQVSQIDFVIRPNEHSPDPLVDHQNKLNACQGAHLDNQALVGLSRLEKRLKHTALQRALHTMLSRYRGKNGV